MNRYFFCKAQCIAVISLSITIESEMYLVIHREQWEHINSAPSCNGHWVRIGSYCRWTSEEITSELRQQTQKITLIPIICFPMQQWSFTVVSALWCHDVKAYKGIINIRSIHCPQTCFMSKCILKVISYLFTLNKESKTMFGHHDLPTPPKPLWFTFPMNWIRLHVPALESSTS